MIWPAGQLAVGAEPGLSRAFAERVGEIGTRLSLMTGYYSEKLAADQLRQAYELAPPRVMRYLQAEIDFIASRLPSDAVFLELGCGYGRVLRPLLTRARIVWGIDTSQASLEAARIFLPRRAPLHLAAMDAAQMAFADSSFDVIACVQNGISAFGCDAQTLVREAVRVVRRSGRALFSSYAAEFWPHRLEWFKAQAAHGLIGEIDYAATGNGTIVCKDGFRATTFGSSEFRDLASAMGMAPRLTEIDGSSLFCELIVE